MLCRGNVAHLIKNGLIIPCFLYTQFMAKLSFNYNLKKDAWSWVLIAKDKNLWGLNWRNQIAQISDELLADIEKASFSKALDVVEEHIKKDPDREYKSKVMDAEMQALGKSWRLIEKKYFKILSGIMQKPIFTDKLYQIK